jgi:hypothetical protein
MNLQLDKLTAKALEEAARAEGRQPDEVISELVERYLKERAHHLPKKKGWLAKVEGSFANDPAFGEVVRLGEEFRASAE